MALKRKHVTLSLSDKSHILDRLEKGESATKLSLEFNVGKSTISDIKKNKLKITSYVSSTESGPSKRQTLKFGDLAAVDEAVYTWFLQEQSLHAPISGEIIKMKAKFFQTELCPDKEFKASNGWFQGFKKRQGICYRSTTGAKLSSGPSIMETFQNKLLKKIEELQLTEEQIYNTNESSLQWRVLPHKTFIHQAEASVLGRKIPNEHITFMPCANISGNHKLKLLVIGKAKNPSAFKNFLLPVEYRNQVNSWMSVDIFYKWFHAVFVPSAKDYLKSINLEEKALLLIGNCPRHPDVEQLISEDGKITAMFLPPNCAAILQPMDQHVNQSIKMKYLKDLLFEVISRNDDIVACLKKFNLKHVVISLAAAWDSIDKALIRASWKKLLPSMIKKIENIDISTMDEIDSLVEMARSVNLEEEITKEHITNWINVDAKECFQLKSDDDIIQEVRKGLDKNVDEEMELEMNSCIKHEDAVKSFNTCIQWATENKIPSHKILLLTQIQKEAIEKSQTSKKLKKSQTF